LKQLMELREPGVAAIASTGAAAWYGAEILLPGIEDNEENYTRFFLIRRRERLEAEARPDKVSLAFKVENRPGSLVEALQVFAGMGTKYYQAGVAAGAGATVGITSFMRTTSWGSHGRRIWPWKCSRNTARWCAELGRYRAAARV